MSPAVPLNLPLRVQGQTMHLHGSVSFDNAAQIYQQGLLMLQQHQHWPLLLDLSGLEASNTIALAVFVQWVRQCKAGQNIVLQHMPEKMQSIIDASNLQAAFA